MKTIEKQSDMKMIKTTILLLLMTNGVFAQLNQDSLLRLSLREAISTSRLSNKAIQASKIEEEAVSEDFEDVKASVLPSISSSGSYQRFTKLTLYTNGLSESKSVPKRPGPDGADLGLNASLNLYSGGRTRSLLEEQQHRAALAELGTREISGGVSLQVAAQYLELIRLSAQKKLAQDQVKRAESRLKNINALYKNQKVTRSDVLRAEVMLSNVQLGMEQIQNDLRIAGDKLKVLLDLSGNIRLQAIDSLGTDSLSPAEIGNLVTDAPKCVIFSAEIRREPESSTGQDRRHPQQLLSVCLPIFRIRHLLSQYDLLSTS